MEINGHEQSQCWGGFRVGKRMTRNYGIRDDGFVEGGYRNFYGEEHRRTITLKGGVLEVTDSINAQDGIQVKSYLHIAPGYSVAGDKIKDKAGNVIGYVILRNCEQMMVCDGELCYYAPEFSDMKTGTCLVFTWKADNDKHGYKIDFNV